MKPKSDYLYKSTLATEFGLIPSLIRALGPPDTETVNPHHRSGPPAQLYRRDRVEHFVAQHTKEIELAGVRRAARQLAAKKATATRRVKTIDIAQQTLVWKPLPKSISRLWRHARSHAIAYEDYEEPGPSAIISTVRHEFTNYDSVLRQIEGRTGSTEAYLTLRSRLDDEIEKLLEATYGDTWHLLCQTAQGPTVEQHGPNETPLTPAPKAGKETRRESATPNAEREQRLHLPIRGGR